MDACYLLMASEIGKSPWIGHFLLAVAGVALDLLALVWVFAVVGLVLQASVKALAGVCYWYPFTLRFLR